MSITTETASTKIDLSELAFRVASLENDVAKLKASMGDKSRWLEAIDGSLKDDPDHEEVLRLGREFRKSDFSE